VFGGEMQFAHFVFFLREAIAIPMALKWSAKLDVLWYQFQEKRGLFLEEACNRLVYNKNFDRF
jgi:hypothetical protein